jgi:acyl-CoA reductase-like NAD-dependent aldehyde dehydrogenase
MKIPNQLFIDGDYRPAPDVAPITLINPATEQPLVEMASATRSVTEEAIASADLVWAQKWRDLPPGKRAEVLYRIAARIRENVETIARLESLQVGKPIGDARDEALLGARVFEYYAGAIAIFGGQTLPVARGGFDFTLRESLGTIAAIVPWNFPFAIACWKTAPALAAGNAVILKPASLTPLTALKLGELCAEAGLPASILQVLPGPGAVIGDVLVSHPLIRKVSFTGSTEIGRRIMAQAAPELKRVSLELGGKSPNIVFADADWHLAADCSPMSVFANTGQDCCARSRIFVERSIFKPFVERLVEATRLLKVGDPMDPHTQIGPMVSEGQRRSVEDFLNDARLRGSEFACGGNRPRPTGYYLEPTVLLNVELSDRCWKEEIFGPVACVVPFDDEATLLREVNNTPYGLSGSIWTRDLQRALRISRGVQSGVLSINSHSSVHVEAPFGGYKQSGIGRDLGLAALEGYTELKNVFIAT